MQLLINAADVGGNGWRAQTEAVGDLLVDLTLRQQVQDVQLARR